MEEKENPWKTVKSEYLFQHPRLTVLCEDMLYHQNAISRSLLHFLKEEELGVGIYEI